MKTSAFCWVAKTSNHTSTQNKKAELIKYNFKPHDIEGDCIKGRKLYIKHGTMGKVKNARHPFLSSDHSANMCKVEAEENHAIGFIDPLSQKSSSVKLLDYDSSVKLAEIIKKA